MNGVDDDVRVVAAAPALGAKVRALKAEEGNYRAKAVATTRQDLHGAAAAAAAAV